MNIQRKENDMRVTVYIEGKQGEGKTTLARKIQALLDEESIEDYFIQSRQCGTVLNNTTVARKKAK
jgi:Mg-chelatase subunit ChlI